MFSIKKVNPEIKNEAYLPICYFDTEGYFHGPAVFESKAEAREYIKRYRQISKNTKRQKLKIVDTKKEKEKKEKKQK